MFLTEKTFKTIISSSPLISIDLIIENSNGEYLLGMRNNRPALGFWFVPGGRILKNETMDNAFSRLCQNELGIDLLLRNAEFLGPFEHFYSDSVYCESISTHYVALGYKIYAELDLKDLPKEQHNQYAWFTRDEIINNDLVHEHTKWYIK